MALSAAELRKSQLPGMAGFTSRLGLIDELITGSLEKKRKTEEEKARLGVQQERIQQAELTARQKLTQAGDFAIQQLQGKQAQERQVASDTAALERIQEAGEQTRKTGADKFRLEKEAGETLLKDLLGAGAGKKKKPYAFSPQGEINIPDTADDELDLEDFLSIGE